MNNSNRWNNKLMRSEKREKENKDARRDGRMETVHFHAVFLAVIKRSMNLISHNFELIPKVFSTNGTCDTGFVDL